jgi:hypothetical protein
MVFQAGVSLLFIGIFGLFQEQMTLTIALTMILAFIGTLITCLSLPTSDPSAGLAEDVDLLWTRVAGFGAITVSALCQTGRLAYQELTFASLKHHQITAMQLAALAGLISSALLVFVLGAAQLLPGCDNGAQVTDSDAARPSHVPGIPPYDVDATTSLKDGSECSQHAGWLSDLSQNTRDGCDLHKESLTPHTASQISLRPDCADTQFHRQSSQPMLTQSPLPCLSRLLTQR